MKKYIILILTILVAACSTGEYGSDTISLQDGWKIEKGDRPEWTDPEFDDSRWILVHPGQAWESQNMAQFYDYNGYAWYRISFILPEDMRKLSYFGEELQITLGAIDDTEQTYLNGELLGVNNKLVVSGGEKPGKFEGDTLARSYFRNYVVPVNDQRIRWGKKNVIAIRVHDHGGNGGMLFSSPSISMVDIKDYLSIDIYSFPFEILGEHFTKNIRLHNTHKNENFSGELIVKVARFNDGKVIYETSDLVEVKANEQYDYLFSFSSPSGESYKIEYIYKVDGARFPLYRSQGAPYVRTLPSTD